MWWDLCQHRNPFVALLGALSAASWVGDHPMFGITFAVLAFAIFFLTLESVYERIPLLKAWAELPITWTVRGEKSAVVVSLTVWGFGGHNVTCSIIKVRNGRTFKLPFPLKWLNWDTHTRPFTRGERAEVVVGWIDGKAFRVPVPGKSWHDQPRIKWPAEGRDDDTRELLEAQRDRPLRVTVRLQRDDGQTKDLDVEIVPYMKGEDVYARAHRI